MDSGCILPHLHTLSLTHAHTHACVTCAYVPMNQEQTTVQSFFFCVCDLAVKIILIYFTEHRFKFLMTISGRPMTVGILLANSSTTWPRYLETVLPTGGQCPVTTTQNNVVLHDQSPQNKGHNCVS